MSGPEDRRRMPIRNRRDPESWMTTADRAEMISLRLTRPQIEAIVRDTRLPGEIAASYKTSAAVILRIQQKYRSRPGTPRRNT